MCVRGGERERGCVCLCVCATDPVAVLVDVDGEVQVHGCEGRSVFELGRRQASVDHVIVESVEQLDVHVAHQSVQDLLRTRKKTKTRRRQEGAC